MSEWIPILVLLGLLVVFDVLVRIREGLRGRQSRKLAEMMSSEFSDFDFQTEKEDIESILDQYGFGRCPRCGGRLIVRQGRFGRFLGCRGYPRCSYARSIE